MESCFAITVIMLGAGGLILIMGSIFLLYVKRIALGRAPKDPALQVQIQKWLSISTNYPALGLFIIGGLLGVAAGWLAYNGEIIKTQIPAIAIPLKGNIKNLDGDPAIISVSTRPVMENAGRQIDTRFNAKMDEFLVRIYAPGYKPEERFLTKEEIEAKIRARDKIILGDIELVKEVAKPIPDPANIAHLPDAEQIVPLAKRSQF